MLAMYARMHEWGGNDVGDGLCHANVNACQRARMHGSCAITGYAGDTCNARMSTMHGSGMSWVCDDVACHHDNAHMLMSGG